MSCDRNALVQNHLRLAAGIARKLWHGNDSARRLGTLDDVVQEAHRALIDAAADFRPELGWQFTTYASRYVYCRLLVAIKNAGIIRVPVHVFERQRQGVLDSFLRSRMVAALSVRQFYNGEDAPAPEEHDPLLEGERLEQLQSALRCLSPRERLVITERFGLESREPKTLEAVGEQLGITRERVRQLQDRALGRLRQRLQAA